MQPQDAFSLGRTLGGLTRELGFVMLGEREAADSEFTLQVLQALVSALNSSQDLASLGVKRQQEAIETIGNWIVRIEQDASGGYIDAKTAMHLYSDLGLYWPFGDDKSRRNLETGVLENWREERAKSAE